MIEVTLSSSAVNPAQVATTSFSRQRFEKGVQLAHIATTAATGYVSFPYMSLRGSDMGDNGGRGCLATEGSSYQTARTKCTDLGFILLDVEKPDPPLPISIATTCTTAPTSLAVVACFEGRYL